MLERSLAVLLLAALPACAPLKAGGDLQRMDASVDDASDAGDDGDAASPEPPDVAPGHLRLWLTADHGLTCERGRVTRWADLSGDGDDALPLQGQLPPECRVVPSPHVINGVDVPYFSAPTANKNVSDETLDVDLTFLKGRPYTIFVVERRWRDDAFGSISQANFLIGTTSPFVDASTPNGVAMCAVAMARNSALQFGYVYYNGIVDLAFDQTCNADLDSFPHRVPMPPPAPVAYDVAKFDPASGRFMYVNGSPAGGDANQRTPLADATGGAVGRALVAASSTNFDCRFHGDIAEVIVYDAALDDPSRQAVESYIRAHWGL
jgi:hypothetical protein